MYLKDRLPPSADATSRAAEGRVVALEKTVASLQGNQADVAKSEANARQQLVKVQVSDAGHEFDARDPGGHISLLGLVDPEDHEMTRRMVSSQEPQ